MGISWVFLSAHIVGEHLQEIIDGIEPPSFGCEPTITGLQCVQMYTKAMGGTPKSSIEKYVLIGFNRMFHHKPSIKWGSSIYGNPKNILVYLLSPENPRDSIVL